MVIKKNPTGRLTRPSEREFGFRNPVNVCLEICRNQAGKFLVEFGILIVGIRNTLSSRNPDPANDLNPNNPYSLDKKCGIQFLESGIRSLEFTIQDRLGFPHMGQSSTVLLCYMYVAAS